MINKKFKTKCDFCRYWTGSSCRVTPNSYYCKEAIDEYYQAIQGKNANNNQLVKSFRKWDRR